MIGNKKQKYLDRKEYIPMMAKTFGLRKARFDFPLVEEKQRVYAIAFDMNTKVMELTYGGPSWEKGYTDIAKVLAKFGFTRQQGSVYFGDREKVNSVTCALAAMTLSEELPWFAESVRDIRLLRIEETNDLMPVVQKGASRSLNKQETAIAG